MEGGTTETKKAICRSFANLIKISPLNGAVDPKAFFMMLNSNFPVLYQSGRLNLAPLWDALAAQHAPESLYGLFLKFEQAAAKLGLSVTLPQQVAKLSGADRERQVQRFGSGAPPINIQDPSGLTPLMEVEVVGGQPPPIELSSSDIKPLIPEEVRKKITQAVVSSIKSAPVGAKVEGAQLGYLVDTNFESLCDGLRFDFVPLLGALRELDGVSDSDIYIGIVRLKEQLEPMGIRMEEPTLDITEDLKHAILKQARERDADAQRMPGGKQPTTRETSKEPRPTGKEQKLKKWGFRGESKSAKILRPIILGLVLVGTGAAGWLTRPNRTLDVGKYNAVFPMRHAQLTQGYFSGTMDEARWFKLDAAAREKSLKALERMLKDDGLLPNLQIRDSQERLVIVTTGTKIAAASFLMKEPPPGAGDTRPPHATPRPADEGKVAQPTPKD